MNLKSKVKEVPGFPGYFADKIGNVYSTKRTKSLDKLRLLKPYINPEGYPTYGLVRDKKRIPLCGHRIVAMAFLPPRPSDHHGVRHLDGNPANNRASNLAWGTQAENIADKSRHGTLATGDRNGRRKHPDSYPIGSKMPTSRLNESQIVEIRRIRGEGQTYLDIAKMFGVAKSTIAAIIVGKNWSHVK